MKSSEGGDNKSDHCKSNCSSYVLTAWWIGKKKQTKWEKNVSDDELLVYSGPKTSFLGFIYFTCVLSPKTQLFVC